MGIFITSRRTLEFKNPDSGAKFRIPNRYLGEVPEWVTRQWAFQSAVKDASITYVGKQAEDVNQPVGEPEGELQALRDQAKELGIPYAAQMGKEKLKAAIAEKTESPEMADENPAQVNDPADLQRA